MSQGHMEPNPVSTTQLLHGNIFAKILQQFILTNEQILMIKCTAPKISVVSKIKHAASICFPL